MKPSETSLDEQLDAIFAARDRDNMQPTITAFEALLHAHPDHPRVEYEVGGSHDTAGNETIALEHYQRALQLGLSGDIRRRCLLQYASTLRNLDRLDESLRVFDDAIKEFPDSVSLPVFRALTLHAFGRPNAALAALLMVIADHVDEPELVRYQPAIRGNAAHVAGLGDQPARAD